MNIFILIFGRLISSVSKILNLGNGSTWPGHVALSLNPNFVTDVFKDSKTKIIFITGTNGKTTTAKLIQTILEKNGKSVFINSSGANLLNGIASSIIINSDLGKLNKDFAIFEVDENALTRVSEKIIPDFLIALNLFRDQLDRYGEIDTIIDHWKTIYNKLKTKTKFILNADDPQIAYLSMDKSFKTSYFGLDDTSLQSENPQHAADSILCPKCSTKLKFDHLYYSHLGNWSCPNCGLKRPQLELSKSNFYPLDGIYNRYNTLAGLLLAQICGISIENIEQALREFKPAFGRQEIIEVKNKKVKFFLAKNPTSFNESLRTIESLNAKNLLLILNDKIPDGRDVSWIWDIDFEILLNQKTNIFISGDRVYDMALRLKYAGVNNFNSYEDLKTSVTEALNRTQNDETLYILPTYSAMLETRKILTGKKIL